MKDGDFLDEDPREPREPRDDLQLALHRDRIVLRLRDVFRSRLGEVRAAGRRLDARIRADIQAMHEEKRGHVRQQLALLPVAKRLVLEPEVMNADSGVVIDEKKPPKNFDALGVPIKPMPTWVHETYLAAGKMDHDILDMVQNLAGHLRNAQAGQIGDYKLPRGIDLRRTSAIDAFVFAISKLWSKGEYTAAEVRRSLDPKRVKNTAATPESVLLKITQDVAHARISRLVPLQEWWDIGLACVLLLDPDFDATRACETSLAPWRGQEGEYDREEMFKIWFETEHRSTLDGLWAWAERTAFNLSHAATGASAHPPARKGHNSLPILVPPGRDDHPAPSPLDPFAAPFQHQMDVREFNRLKLDEKNRRLAFRKSELFLTGREWQLVHHLFTHAGHVFQGMELAQSLWTRPTKHSLPGLADRVRKKLKSKGFPATIFPSQPRGKYRFVLPGDDDVIAS